jgi:hypothetical protein
MAHSVALGRSYDRAHGGGDGDGPPDAPEIVRLGRFYVGGETADELSLVVGLSHPWPEAKDPAGAEHAAATPVLELRPDAGRDPATVRTLRADAVASSPRMLVFKGPRGARIDAGWYTAALRLGAGTRAAIPRRGIDFTFSAGSSRPNHQLVVATVGPREGLGDDGMGKAQDGVTVEIELLVGRPVIGAPVVGVYQESRRGVGPILARMLQFLDDGVGFDHTKNDGIYTGRFFNPPGEGGVQVQLSIEARPDVRSRFVPMDVPGGEDRGGLDREAVPPFQRATSLTVILPP